MQSIPSILNEIAATSSMNEKKRLLKENKSGLFAKIFSYAYDPFITFGVHKIQKPHRAASDFDSYSGWHSELFELLDQLATRELTGNLARVTIDSFLLDLDEAHQELVINIIKKDLRIGASVRTINTVYEGLLPENFCMLASKYESKRIKEWPVYVDVKLDGVRSLAIMNTDEVAIYSRNRKEFKNYSTIEKELMQLDKKYKMLDGEITAGHFQDLMRTVSRKNDGIALAADAIYNIFDIPSVDDTFDKRIVLLEELAKEIEEKKLAHLKVVTGKLVMTEEELNEFYAEQLENGEEGVMIKTLDSKYEFKRSFAWMKKKPALSEDLIIIDVEEGTGKYIGQLGAVVCQLDDRTVHVGSGFSDEEREKYWREKDVLFGKMIEVKYQEKTKDNSLRFPVFVRFREDKQL